MLSSICMHSLAPSCSSLLLKGRTLTPTFTLIIINIGQSGLSYEL